tara:strand:- start:219 stop:413 length:195 start_codon:yes stop_codon:yes gene_type:complete
MNLLDCYQVINLKLWFLFDNAVRSDAFSFDGILLDADLIMPLDLQVDHTDTSSYLSLDLLYASV